MIIYYIMITHYYLSLNLHYFYDHSSDHTSNKQYLNEHTLN